MFRFRIFRYILRKKSSPHCSASYLSYTLILHQPIQMTNSSNRLSETLGEPDDRSLKKPVYSFSDVPQWIKLKIHLCYDKSIGGRHPTPHYISSFSSKHHKRKKKTRYLKNNSKRKMYSPPQHPLNNTIYVLLNENIFVAIFDEISIFVSLNNLLWSQPVGFSYFPFVV